MKPEPVECKEICGVLHWKVPCWSCEELVWFQYPGGMICHDCMDVRNIGVGRDIGSTPRSEQQYNG